MVKVTDPSGRTWTIRRRWLPGSARRLVRFRGRRIVGESLDAASGFGDLSDAPLIGAVFAVPAILAIAVAIVLGAPALIMFVLGVAVALVATVVAVLGRIVLRRPWQVEAANGVDRRQWSVVGWRASGRLRDELGQRFRDGADPTPTSAAEPRP